MNRLKYVQIRFQFRRDIWSQSSKNLTSRCAWHCGVKILGLANQKNFHQIFSFMIEVFTSKRILIIVPLKATRDQQNFLFWLRCVQLDSAVWSTPRDRVAWLRGDYFENVCFCIFEFVTSLNYVISKHVWSKKRFLEQFVTISIICIVISYL